MGINHPDRKQMGDIFSALVTGAIAYYQGQQQLKLAKKRLKMEKEQAAAANAREAEAMRIQQESMAALTVQQQAVEATADQDKILGMKPTTFYIAAGLAAGAAILGAFSLAK